MTTAVNHRMLEAAIDRAFALGRVDQSIQVAADELRRMVAADPRITPWRVLQLYRAPAGRWSNVPDWDHALWWVADVWCELYRRLQGRAARQPPASPYSVLRYAIAAREVAETQICGPPAGFVPGPPTAV
jgi:hypothetical protein